MDFRRITHSLCPVCYKRVEACVRILDGYVHMGKYCGDHGYFDSTVERDPRWWAFCQQKGDRNIYDGYIIDVTGRCNIKCKYCYHDRRTDRTTESIIEDALSNRHRAPFILSGGEPTLHKSLPYIVETLSGYAETWVLTNGIALQNRLLLEALMDGGLLREKTLLIGLSFHPEAKGQDISFLDLCRDMGLVLGTTFFVIDNIFQIETALRIYREYPDVIQEMRIKAASNLWAERKVEEQIFVSDMLNYLAVRGPTTVETENCCNKPSYANVTHDGMNLKLISWYNVRNVDLEDIDCAPWYRARDGQIYNLVTACLVNERLSKIMTVYYPDAAEAPQGSMWERSAAL